MRTTGTALDNIPGTNDVIEPSELSIVAIPVPETAAIDGVLELTLVPALPSEPLPVDEDLLEVSLPEARPEVRVFDDLVACVDDTARMPSIASANNSRNLWILNIF